MMSEGFAYIDILFFAMVAAFIALRLRSVLGRRTGSERRRGEEFSGARANGAADNVVALPDRTGDDDRSDDAIAELAEGDVKSGLTAIRIADRQFDLGSCVAGARGAFEMIVDAYAAGDKGALRPLLDDEVFARFAGAIDQRQADGHTLETQVVALDDIDVIEAAMIGSRARVVIRFASEQINVVRDGDGNVVDGDPIKSAQVVDIWTFERDVRNRDPNWTLVETRTPS
jgi:predicted lipid-binding transport protein (Tim44 family)